MPSCVVLCLVGFVVAACSGGEKPPEKLNVFVSIAPQACWAKRIGGEHVTVHVLVGRNQDPHTFELTPKQMTALGEARLYFTVGLPFEARLVQKLQGGGLALRIVDTSQGITKRPSAVHVAREDAEGHTPGAAPAEAGEALDPHIWLAPPLIRIQAQHVAQALIEADPAHRTDYESNLQSFLRDLDVVDARVRQALAPYAGRSFYVFHPAFGYFGDAYGLRQETCEIEGKTPTPRQLDALIEKARAENVKIVFVQPQFDPRGAEALAQSIGGMVVPLDDLAEDMLENLVDMAKKIEESFARSGAARSESPVPKSLSSIAAPCHCEERLLGATWQSQTGVVTDGTRLLRFARNDRGGHLPEGG